MKTLTAIRHAATKHRCLVKLPAVYLPALLAMFSGNASAQVDLNRVEQFHEPAAEHCIQDELLAIGDPLERFLDAFECGDELFATHFNALDGVGANVGDGQRFARVPRADLNAPDQWANHFPSRATGPNAEACTTCHNLPFEDGAGLAGLNVVRDPLHSANPGQFITRNTPHLFAPGALQLLAEEMTSELQAIRAAAVGQATQSSGMSCTVISVNTWPGNYQVDVQVTNNSGQTVNGWSVQLSFVRPANIYNSWNVTISNGNSTNVTAGNVAYNTSLSPGQSISFGIQGTRSGGTFTPPTCSGSGGGGGGSPVTLALVAKGVSFGSITANPDGSIDASAVDGVDDDLVIKPFQWKGNTTTVRAFNRDASHNELGMQSVETTGDDFDGDGDEIVNELGIGDQSALAVYLAAQPRPVTMLEMNDWGLVTLTAAQISSIQNGASVFAQIGCDSCHQPSLAVDNPNFSEPSQHPAFRDAVFPAGQDPLSRNVNPANPIGYNLLTDPPSNIIEVNGQPLNIGAFEANGSGGATVRLYGDLKRHDMGPGLAENIDETGVGASVWITKELWGVGSTAPYLHDGRATTLTEAILLHGGEATAARNAAAALGQSSHEDLLNFLNNLVLFKVEEE